MALVKCKECGAEVSTKATSCPKCGAKPPKKTSIITWMVLLFIVASVWLSATTDSPPASASSGVSGSRSAAADQELKQIAWMDRGKDMVLQRLKDPKSAEFKDVYFLQGTDGVPMTCGLVNAKNSFGGYTGFKHFVSAGTAELTFLETEVKDFHAVWNKYCTKS